MGEWWDNGEGEMRGIRGEKRGYLIRAYGGMSHGYGATAVEASNHTTLSRG